MNTEHTRTTSAPVVGVRTTRIYCRPVCRPGRAPRRENCVPFPDAATARAAGYRPCKQCRPDDAPLPRPVVRYGTGPTPFGSMLVGVTDRGVCGLYLLDGDDPESGLRRLRRDAPGAEYVEDPGVAAEILPRVVAYVVEGDPCDDVPLDPRGTPFQRRVWEGLRAIPHGETTTYGALARSLGLPAGAARAVGAACGANPVTLLIPCHRVVSTGGGLGGYYWGLDVKQALLDTERDGRRQAAGSAAVLTAVP